jgi:hypothetical protein
VVKLHFLTQSTSVQVWWTVLHMPGVVHTHYPSGKNWAQLLCFYFQVPDNIENLRHQLGEFPIQFLGTNDYYWINQVPIFSHISVRYFLAVGFLLGI